MLDAIGIESSASEESSGVESNFSDFSEFQQSFASDYDQLKEREMPSNPLLAIILRESDFNWLEFMERLEVSEDSPDLKKSVP